LVGNVMGLRPRRIIIINIPIIGGGRIVKSDNHEGEEGKARELLTKGEVLGKGKEALNG